MKSVCGHLALLWVILRLLWASEGCFGVIMLHVQKTIIFAMDFNDFIILWGHLDATLGKFWFTLALLWVYDGGFGPLLGHFGVTLGT